MRIRPFGVEQWMNEYETRCDWNLAETCVESLTVAELLEMADRAGSILDELLPMKLTYGPIEGSGRLRDNVAALYADQSRENVLITHGASGANQLAYLTLVEPGDRVVSALPTYQQHYSIPESIGADVRILRLREDNGFLPDLDELRELAGGAAKLIVISNPNNPTGALMHQALLEQIAAIADACGAFLLCDEVYRGTDQDGTGTTASVVDVYDRGVSTGSMSKAFSLAGLRLGWITAPTDLIHAISIHRDYNTISVGMLDDVGGFNWSSQHLDRGGCDGQASAVDEGVDGQVADEVAGQAVASARCRASVLAVDRRRLEQRGRGTVGRGVAGGWQPMVQGAWRDGDVHARPGLVPVLVL